MAKTPDQIAEKWQRAMSAAGQSITDGVNAVTESPTEKAARRADAYAAGVQRAVADGTYQAGLRRVTTQDWKTAMLQKGIPRIATGVQQAKPKVQAFMSQWMPYVNAGVDSINASTPRGDFQTNVARMVAMAEYNHNFKRNR